MNRREVIGLLGAAVVGNGLSGGTGWRPLAEQDGPEPRLAPGAPMSPERLALITDFKATSDGIETLFEARSHKGEWTMPYRLFRPKVSGTLPLVLFLHGSGGLGTDNEKQMGLGNIFGTRVWALPENQKRFPCFVCAPQADRGWMRYADPAPGDSVARVVPGLGDGAKLALEVVEELVSTLPIDRRRIYVTGQSMGGGGVWHLTAQRPQLFAAAVSCCGSRGDDRPADSASTPTWNFHGTADQTVPIAVSRDRIAAVRRAGGHPVATEYPGIGHNSWEWAYTEPALLPWVFDKRRKS